MASAISVVHRVHQDAGQHQFLQQVHAVCGNLHLPFGRENQLAVGAADLAGSGDGHSLQGDGGVVQYDGPEVGAALYAVQGDVFRAVADARKHQPVVAGRGVLQDELAFRPGGDTAHKGGIKGLQHHVGILYRSVPCVADVSFDFYFLSKTMLYHADCQHGDN